MILPRYVEDNTVVQAALALRMNVKRGKQVNSWILIPDTRIPSKARPFTILTIDRRRTAYVCWHGHLAFLMRLYNKHPMMDIDTKIAKYESRSDFRIQVLNDERIVPDGKRCTCNQNDIECALEGDFPSRWETRIKAAINEPMEKETSNRVRV